MKGCLSHTLWVSSVPGVTKPMIAGGEECWLIPVAMSGAIHVSLGVMIVHCVEEVRFVTK